MRRDEISIADIARVAGVSHTTVSRALRESSLISVETRERIQKLAYEMGYTPNAIAQSLQTRQTSTIGLVVTSIADPFFGDVMKGVEEVARAAGFSVLLSASYNDPQQAISIIETFHRRRVDGIIVASSRITNGHHLQLRSLRIPTVFINSELADNVLHWIAVDDCQGTRMAVEHLLSLGHRAIGYVGSSGRPLSNQQRLRGYHEALAEAGLEAREEWIVIASGEAAAQEEDLSAGRQALPQLLEAGVTAIFCYNDMSAIGMLAACHEQGIVVPRDLSIVGFDDIAISACVTPPLTTVRQPRSELGRLATHVLLDLLGDQPGSNYMLLPELVQRGSTASPRI